MAEFERSLVQARVKACLRNARAKGKKFGKPRAHVDAGRVAELRRDGLSWSQVMPNAKRGQRQHQRSVARLGALDQCDDATDHRLGAGVVETSEIT